MTVKEDIVQRGVEAHALIDKHLARAFKAAEKYAGVVENAITAGMFQGRALVAKEMLADARSLPGEIAAAARHAAHLHRSGTDVAIANDVDLGTVTSVGGVELPASIGIMGGGGR